jgi:iron complex outermembrane receptor protein
MLLLAVLPFAVPAPAAAQSDPQASTAGTQPPIRLKLPALTVHAQKEPADKQKIPISVTAVPEDVIRDAGIFIVSDAALYSPNTFFTEFTARKVSVPRIRGIGSSPGNPAITTYFDGVPQLHTSSSNIDLLDVSQIEFVRGPQGALFGRNTIGGLINVETTRPSTGRWTGRFEVPIANYDGIAARASASGGLVDGKLAAGISFSRSERAGYTVNALTTNDLDSRSAFAMKGQLLWTPITAWDMRIIVSAERDRDGDYGLQDLASLRTTPYTAMRDYEGFTDRDVAGLTVVARRTGTSATFTSTTGLVRWSTTDSTDLDYTPFPAIERNNAEQDLQFTHELRFASAGQSRLRWQGGVFFFTQNFEQDAVNSLAAGVFAPFPLDMHTPKADLDDAGVGLFGQATMTFADRVDVTGGLRFDYESKKGHLETFFDPAIAAPVVTDEQKSFNRASPQVSLAFRMTPAAMLYGTYGGGFKAGGFNPAAPAGSETYGEERTWLGEFGVKTTLAGGRVTANAAVFFLTWDDLQLNVPDLTLPAQFYIANAGSASSKGVEFELNARAVSGSNSVDVFTSVGFTRARFGDDAVSNGVPVAGRTLANVPDYTFSAGTQFTHQRSPATSFYGRLEFVQYGAFHYDDMNLEQQNAYALAHLRGGARLRYFYVEGWMRNAFDTQYIPVAFPYPGFAQSGFVGEMGPPRAFGITGGVRF